MRYYCIAYGLCTTQLSLRVGFVRHARQQVHIVPQMQGLRWARKRSLQTVNEHFEPERNAADAVRDVLV